MSNFLPHESRFSTRAGFVNRRLSFFASRVLAVLALCGSVPASADIHGFLAGRSVDPGTLPPLSVEIGFQDLDFFTATGVRLNFRYNANTQAFVNASAVDTDVDGLEGFSIGAGAFIFLPRQRLWTTVDLAVKPSLNFFSVDSAFFDLDTIAAAFEFQVSSKETIGNTSLKWFANAGLNVLFNNGSFPGASGTEFEPLAGGGLYLPLFAGQFLIGVELFDGTVVPGIGFRFFL